VLEILREERIQCTDDGQKLPKKLRYLKIEKETDLMSKYVEIIMKLSYQK
jgi:hypothetical protein